MSPSIPPQLPPKLIAAQDIVPTTQRIVDENRAVRITVVQQISSSSACFDNVIQPIIDVEHRNNGLVNLIATLRFASPDQASRTASETALQLLSEAHSESLNMSDYHKLLECVKKNSEDLDSESTKVVDEMLRDYRRCGYGMLDSEGIAEFLRSRDEIDRLRRQFNRNLMDDNSGVWVTSEELHGVPPSEMERFEAGSGPHAGQYFVHLTKADIEAVFKYALNPATRKKVYIANDKKVEQNVQIFKDITSRRDENARKLNYPSHAAYRLENRMAKTPQWVNNLLDDLEATLKPRGEKEMGRLLAKKREHQLSNGEYIDKYPDIMPPWDYSFYTRLAEEDSEIDQQKISEYFPLQPTTAAMLKIFSSCLQLRFERMPAEQLEGCIWHDDVEAWSVWDDAPDASDPFVGYLYTDVLFRPNKHRGCQDCNIQGSFIKPDGSRMYPVTVLMCDFPRPTSTGCALLKHKEVVTLFHELGHGIHDLLARTNYAMFHGWAGPTDFVEIPSLMLENWCWLKSELLEMSCHYTTVDAKYLQKWQEEHPGEPLPPTKIPEKWLDDLLASRNRGKVLRLLDILSISRYDMDIHNSQNHEHCNNLDLKSIFNNYRMKLRMLPLPDPEDQGHPHVHFSHLVSGLDVGYYSYLSGQVIAANIFNHTFAKDPRSLVAWDRYRREILQFGGSRDELEMLEAFLGGPVSTNPFLRSLD